MPLGWDGHSAAHAEFPIIRVKPSDIDAINQFGLKRALEKPLDPGFLQTATALIFNHQAFDYIHSPYKSHLTTVDCTRTSLCSEQMTRLVVRASFAMTPR